MCWITSHFGTYDPAVLLFPNSLHSSHLSALTNDIPKHHFYNFINRQLCKRKNRLCNGLPFVRLIGQLRISFFNNAESLFITHSQRGIDLDYCVLKSLSGNRYPKVTYGMDCRPASFLQMFLYDCFCTLNGILLRGSSRTFRRSLSWCILSWWTTSFPPFWLIFIYPFWLSDFSDCICFSDRYPSLILSLFGSYRLLIVNASWIVIAFYESM